MSRGDVHSSIHVLILLAPHTACMKLDQKVVGMHCCSSASLQDSFVASCMNIVQCRYHFEPKVAIVMQCVNQNSSITCQNLFFATNLHFCLCQGSSSLACVVGLLMLPCMCRLTVELEANRSAGPKVAGGPTDESSPVRERRPAVESRPHLQCLRAGLQTPHVQAQPQVHSLIYELLIPTIAFVHDCVRWQMVSCAS